MKPTIPLRNEAAELGDGGGGAAAVAAVPDATATATATATTAAASAAPSYFNPDGSFGENWQLGLGDEFSPHAAALAPFKDVKSLAKSYVHFRSTGPAYPGEQSSPEDVQRFRAVAQVPIDGTAAAYGITLPDDATDLNRSTMDRLAKAAHEAHVPLAGFQKIVMEYKAMEQAAQQEYADALQAETKAAQDALVGEWRGNYEPNKSIVRHIATTFATQAGVDLESPAFQGMLDNPAFARVMLEVSKATQEDRIMAPAGMGDLRAPQQVADSIMEGKDPTWGEKYVSGNREEKVAAAREVARLLSLAAK
jgi:hypothetical protein